MRIAVAMPNHHGCGYHRALVPLRALAKRGVPVRLMIGLEEDAIAEADVLYLPLGQSKTIYELALAFRARGGRVVYEFDDDVRATPLDNPARSSPRFELAHLWVERIMRICDLVVTSTPTLAERYRDVNHNMVVLRNSIDPDDVGEYFDLGEPEDATTLRIGFAGAGAHSRDVAAIAPALATVLARHPSAQIVVIGADFRAVMPESIRDRMHYGGRAFPENPDGSVREFCVAGETWPSLRYLRLIADQRLHVAIAPLIDDPFNQARSDLKALEYGALGIPVIASDVTPYRAYVEDPGAADTIMLAATLDDWTNALDRLLSDPAERARLRGRNRAHIRSQRLVAQTIAPLETALNGLFSTH